MCAPYKCTNNILFFMYSNFLKMTTNSLIHWHGNFLDLLIYWLLLLTTFFIVFLFSLLANLITNNHVQSNIAHEEELMEKLNSALIAGEIPFLFTNDEMEGLLQSLQVISHLMLGFGNNVLQLAKIQILALAGCGCCI